MLTTALIVLLLAGGVFYFVSNRSTSSGPNVTASSSNGTKTATRVATTAPTSAPTTVPDGLYIPGTYNGAMTDESGNNAISISVYLQEQRGSGALKGAVTFKPPAPSVGTFPLAGTVDKQGNFSFTVQQPSGKTPFYMYGTVQHNGGTFLHGNYCNSSTNSCLAPAGFFTVGPGY